MSTPKHTPLQTLGEFGLIKHLTKAFQCQHANTLTGIGDDAAVIRSDQCLVVTTDLLVEGVHFDLTYTPLTHLGYKSVVVNLSDIAAMNAAARQITVSIALSNRFSVEMTEELYKGISLACKHYAVDLIGGDTTSSYTGLQISVTAIGEAPQDTLTYRDGAKKNQLICVSGDLGGAYAGLQLLEREKEVFKADPNMTPQFKGYDYILQRQLKPEARLDMMQVFREMNLKPTAMIDISDGLSSELMHICEASGVGCKVYEDKLPVAKETISLAKELNIDPNTFIMNGGEDYELLFTLPLDNEELLRYHPDITMIGYTTDDPTQLELIARNGAAIPIKAQGWNAMNQNES